GKSFSLWRNTFTFTITNLGILPILTQQLNFECHLLLPLTGVILKCFQHSNRSERFSLF
ncbi:hypothetical protein NDU88_002046, partial [Pleurodeles waltl]